MPTKSPSALAIQLNQWLHDSANALKVGKKPSSGEVDTIINIIEMGNRATQTIFSPVFQKLRRQELKLIGNVKLAGVTCVDGRLKKGYPLGFILSSWEEPAGLIQTRKSKDGKLIPESTILATGISRWVSKKYDLLELVEAHTSFTTDHKCGAIAKMKSEGLIAKDEEPEEANIRLLKQLTIPAITNQYNRIRIAMGLEPLKVVGLPILFDTDTFGIWIDYDKRHEHKPFSTTEATLQLKEAIEVRLRKKVGPYGSKRAFITKLNNLVQLFEEIFLVTKLLLSDELGFKQEINGYLDRYHKLLTKNQRWGMIFVLAKTVAFQYITGLASFTHHPTHPFADHAEEFIAISLKGKTVAQRHPNIQTFGTSASNRQSAIQSLLVEISIREHYAKKTGHRTPHIVFITNPINKKDIGVKNVGGLLTQNDNETVQRSTAGLVRYVRTFVDHEVLGAMIKKGKVILVPGLIDEMTRELLRIPNIAMFI